MHIRSTKLPAIQASRELCYRELAYTSTHLHICIFFVDLKDGCPSLTVGVRTLFQKNSDILCIRSFHAARRLKVVHQTIGVRTLPAADFNYIGECNRLYHSLGGHNLAVKVIGVITSWFD